MRIILFTTVIALGAAAAIDAAGPKSPALDAWNTVVTLTEQRLACSVPCAARQIDERMVAAGKIYVTSRPVVDEQGRELRVPAGTIEYWRGAIVLPHVTLAQLLESLLTVPPHQPDVLASRILWRDNDRIGVQLRVRRKSILTVVYDTDHEMAFRRESAGMATSRSVMTSAVEIVDAGAATEHARPPADDRGFLWRLNSYWRYQERPDGVLAVLDSLTLSRDVPFIIRPIAGPIIRRVAAESVTAALQGLRDRDYSRIAR